MAGTIITRPVNGATDWTNFDTIQSRSMKGFLDMSLEGMTTGSVPTILAGSHIEINASIYQFSSDYAPNASSWTAIASSSNVFLKAVPSGTTCTVEYTTTAPTWSSSKKGWYTSNDRAFAWMRKDSTGLLYKYKHFLPLTETRQVIFTEVLDIGDWNMDTTDNVDTAHELATANIRSITAYIRQDVGEAGGERTFPLNYNSGGSAAAGFGIILSTETRVFRLAGGFFDGVLFNSTSYNRGWIHIDHEEI